MIAKCWSDVFQGPKLVVWERRVLVTLLCAFFMVAQSTPAALALFGGGSSSFTVVCSGSGLEVVQIDRNGDKQPVKMQIDCNCCLAPNNHLFAPASLGSNLEETREIVQVSYASGNSSALSQAARYRTACRGPPLPIDGFLAFSDPPDLYKSVANRSLRSFLL